MIYNSDSMMSLKEMSKDANSGSYLLIVSGQKRLV